MDDKPRLLVVSPVFPYPLIAGGRIRIYHLLREMSRDFRITLLTLVDPVDDTERSKAALSFLDELVTVPIQQDRPRQLLRLLLNIPAWLRGTPIEVMVKKSRKLRQELETLLRSRKYDAALIEYAQCIQYVDPIRARGLPLLLIEHDIFYISLGRRVEVSTGLWRWLWRAEERRMRRYEIDGWRRFDRIITMSDVDRGHVLSEWPQAEVDVVPNGVDVETLQKKSGEDTRTILFVGWMRHLPNRDAIWWLLSEIWPLIRSGDDEVRLQIVGKGLPGELQAMVTSDERVDYLGYVEDVASIVTRACVSVVPIRIGSGSRLKILESMALGTPIVSTTIGCEGIAARDGEEIVIADDRHRFSKSVIELLTDRDERTRISENARRLVEQSYSWSQIGIRASAAVRRAISEKVAEPSPSTRGVSA